MNPSTVSGPGCSSVIEGGVDQRDLVAPAHDIDLAYAEQLAELARGHRDRTRLADARLSGRGQRIRKRLRRMKRDVAFDLLQHLVDMAVENGDRAVRTQQRHGLRG